MDTPETRFSILKSFLGFGNPSAPIWFVGLEEAGEWSENPQEDEKLYQEYAKGHFPIRLGSICTDAKRYGRRYTKVYDIMSKVVVSMLSDSTTLDCKSYRDKHLLQERGQTFQTNLYPLGKPSVRSWPEAY